MFSPGDPGKNLPNYKRFLGAGGEIMASLKRRVIKYFFSTLLVAGFAFLLWDMLLMHQEPVIDDPEVSDIPIRQELTEPQQRALVRFLSLEVPKHSELVVNKYIPPYRVSVERAENLISWQLDYDGLGGWSKNFPKIYERRYNGTEDKSYQTTQDGDVWLSHLDNDATTSEILYLAAVYSEFPRSDIRQSILKATHMIIIMQHEQGSWPECYPEQTWDSSRYENHGTINDQVHFNNMSMFQKILNEEYPFDNDLFNQSQKQDIQKSYDLALDFVIRSQLRNSSGDLTLWAGKYHMELMEPMWARHFEPPAIMNLESQKILFHLLSIPEKSPEVRQAIYSGALWMYKHAVLDVEYRINQRPYFFHAPGMKMWYRFQDPETKQGVYGLNREIVEDIMDLPEERRHGYRWATDVGSEIYDATHRFLRYINQ